MTIDEIRAGLNDIMNDQGIDRGVIVEADTMLRRCQEMLSEHDLPEPDDAWSLRNHQGLTA